MVNNVFQNPNSNPILSALGALKGNPHALFERMYSTNVSFRQFADSMRGKTPEQAFKENGIDYEQIKNLLR